MANKKRISEVRALFQSLLAAWGPQDWWPAHTRLEVIAGAILTQNTSWWNVERALGNLRRAGALNLQGLRNTPLRELEQMVRSAGYFRQKARRLKNFVSFVDERYGGSLERMFARPTPALRGELLALNGIGPETADSILLYAGGHPVFVVDAYTRRIFDRHRMLPASAPYEEFRHLVERAFTTTAQPDLLPATMAPAGTSLTGKGRRRHKFVLRRANGVARAYDEFHALLVAAAKHHCLKAEAKCEGCPLQPLLPRPIVPARLARRPRQRGVRARK